MKESGTTFLYLFLIFGGAKLFAAIFERLRQPAVIGEIVAGIALGPSLLGWIQPHDPVTHGLAEIGAIFLLFTIGLETKPKDLLAVGKTSALVAVLGVLLPLAGGYFYMRVAGYDLLNSFFLAAAIVATSVGITARVLKDAGALLTRLAQIILGAAVLDDILGMIVLAIVISLATGTIDYLQIGIVAVEAIGFSLLVVFFGPRIVGHLQPAVDRFKTPSASFVFSILLCLGFSLASVYIGMAAIIGAFLAGLALANQSDQWGLSRAAHPIYEFLGPFFFVSLGEQVNVKTLLAPGPLWILAVVFALAVFTKLVGCGLGALLRRTGAAEALGIGIGMIPRGEVGLIVAGVGLNLHAISDEVYAIVVMMSVATTLFAPPVLRWYLPYVSRRAGINNAAA